MDDLPVIQETLLLARALTARALDLPSDLLRNGILLLFFLFLMTSPHLRGAEGATSPGMSGLGVAVSDSRAGTI